MCLKAEEKVESVKRSLQNRIFESAKIKVVWHTKAHRELIKSLQYIPEEQLLITTSSDKKVKIWDPSNGCYLDSLQQNYTKTEPAPLAYFNTKTSTLHSADLKLSKQIEELDPTRLQFDPFVLTKLLIDNPEFAKSNNSNEEWKVNV
jgi:WD40 repeat protein